MTARKKPPKRAASTKKGRGRPSAYRPEYSEQAEKLCLLGATDKDVAEFFGTTEKTVNAWKQRHGEFREALKRGKQIADMHVADRLYQRAMGYTHKAEKIFCYEGQIVRAEFTEHYAPDTTAAIFWLKNRQPKQWRDKQQVEHSGQLDVNLDEVRSAIEGKLARIAGAGAAPQMAGKPH